MSNIEVSDVVGSRVREIRRSLNLTVEQLAERCATAGVPVTPGAVYLIEGGGRGAKGRARRKITVDELFALSLALDVSPAALLFPRENVPYHITPAVTEVAEKAARWLIGLRPLPTQTANITSPGSAAHPGAVAEREARFYAEIPAYMAGINPAAEELIRRVVAETLKSAGKSEQESEEEEGDESGGPDDKNDSGR